MSGRVERAFTTRTPQATEAIGERLAAALRDGDVVSVVGELGAGKSCFVRGALRGLGIAGGGQSPTFVVERRYDGRVVAHHIDLYRIEGQRALAEIGIPDRFADGGVFLVEWGDRAEGLLPMGRIEVRIVDEGAGVRRIVVGGAEERLARLGEPAAAGERSDPDA